MIFPLLFGLVLAAQQPTKPMPAPLSAESCVLGVVHPMVHAKCRITVSNPTSRAWSITSVVAADHGIQVPSLPLYLKPGESRDLVLDWSVGSKSGRRAFAARLAAIPEGSNDNYDLMLRGTGFVYSIFDNPTTKLDIGAVEPDSPKIMIIKFHSDDAPGFRVSQVTSLPPFAVADIAKDHSIVKVGVSADSQWGLQHGEMVLATNEKDEPKVVVQLSANVLGSVRPSDNPYALGVLRTNVDNVISVPLTSMDGKPFKVGKITLDRIAGDVSVGPCVNARPGCRLVSLVLSKDQPTGNLGSQMHIELPDYHKTLTVGFWGVLLKPDTKIIDLDKAQDETAKGAKSKAVDGPVDFGKALKKSSTPPVLPPADPPGDGPVLRWSVANEQSLYGYLIYRAEHKDGPWQRVNDKIIPVLGHDDATSEYAWRDTSAVKGKTYWYFIKTLGNNGTKARLTGVQKVVAH